MKKGRYERPAPAKKRPAYRKKLNKYFLVTLSLVLLLGVAGGATLAYMMTEGGTVTNSFTPGKVACSVDDNYRVTNTGNVDAYIRVAVVINWENADGDINGIAPVKGDYTLELNDDWKKGEDGYYYYTGKVAPNTTIPSVVKAITEKTAAPAGFNLVVEVLAEAIQAEGMGATSAEEAWAKAKTLPTGN